MQYQYLCQGNTCTCIEFRALNFFPIVSCQRRHSPLSSGTFCIAILNIGQIQICQSFLTRSTTVQCYKHVKQEAKQ